MNEVISERSVVQSALWAAYGDALGFITELADEGRVEHRVGSSAVSTTVPWRRKISARSSVFVEFPAGAYSDDTQLRLSASRCIRADGTFDVASFAKVELTAWLNYALGAGLSSREAAANLARTSATWYSNFFSGKRSRYVEAGGNGAAMRVQPHVWALRRNGDLQGLYREVVRNSICTHGHPRAIVGACLHAATLNFAFERGRAANLAEVSDLLLGLRELGRIIEADNDIRLFWVDQWTSETKESFSKSVNRTVDEIDRDIAALSVIDSDDVSEAYRQSLNALDALAPASRGSGTKTALLANYVASIAAKWDVDKILVLVANQLGSDTDSIGTMAGAIAGAYCNSEMTHALQDKEYIEKEARRLYQVANNAAEISFRYPDLRSWKPQRAAVDAILKTDDGLLLNGIARANLYSDKLFVENDGTALQWIRLSFGQTVLAKMRENPTTVEDVAAHVVRERSSAAYERSYSKGASRLPDLFSQSAPVERPAQRRTSQGDDTLNSMLEHVIESGFDPSLVGRLVLQQADGDKKDFVERGIALTSTILTAYRARTRRRNQ